MADGTSVQRWPAFQPWHHPKRLWQTQSQGRYFAPLAKVCRWIGNSPAIAAKHYAVSVDLDADFKRAAGTEAQQKAQQSAAVCAEQRLTTIPSDDEKSQAGIEKYTLGNAIQSLSKLFDGPARTRTENQEIMSPLL